MIVCIDASIPLTEFGTFNFPNKQLINILFVENVVKRNFNMQMHHISLCHCMTPQLQHRYIICICSLTFTSRSSQPPSFPPHFFVDPNSGHRFRSKYHPDEASRLKSEAQSALQNRLNVFMFLIENGWFDSVSLDIELTPAIIKVLDAGEDSKIVSRVLVISGVKNNNNA